MSRTNRSPAQVAILLAAAWLPLAGCQPAATPLVVRPTMVLDRLADGPAATGAAATDQTSMGLAFVARGDVDLSAPPATPATTSAAAPSAPAAAVTAPPARSSRGAGGGRPGAPATVASDAMEFWVRPDGRHLPAAAADVVTLPERAPGLWSFFAPGRVPSTIEVDDAPPPSVHPRLAAGPEAATTTVALTGIVVPPIAGAIVMYAGSSGRSAASVAVTDADGTFRLSVPVASPEEGVVVVHAKASRGLARVRLAPDAPAEARVDLVTPAAGQLAFPAAPASLAPAESVVAAVVETAAGPVRAPLWTDDAAPYDAPPTYALADAAVAVGFVARSADGLAGSATSGPAEGVPAFLAPPDLAGLPEVLAPGAALAWPPVPGATLYTVRLTATVDGTPLWEAAIRGPRVVVPAALVLDARATIEVTAWDAAGVTSYSVAGLRALRLPDDLPGVVGRHSWAARAYGPSGKS